MIQDIREWATSWAAYIFIILICLSFGLWGIHSYFETHTSGYDAATVNGDVITAQSYNHAYERARQLALQQSDNSSPLTAIQQQAIKTRVMSELINNQILLQAAVKEGYTVPLGAVTATIENMDQFKTDGHFSPELYRRFINSGWYAPEEFIDAVRAQQLTQQIQLGFIATSFSLEQEDQLYAKLSNQTRDITVINVPLTPVSNSQSTVSDEDLKNFYEHNQHLYVIPEKVSIEYVKVSLEDLIEDMHPTDEQLKAYFQANKDKFSSVFADNKEEVKKDYVAEQAIEQLSTKFDTLLNLSFEQPNSLEPTAKALNTVIQDTEFFDRSGGESAFTKNPLVIEAAFSEDVLNNNNNSQVINLSANSHVVIRLKAHKPESVKPFNEVKNSIKTQLLQSEAMARSKELATSVLSAIQQGKTPQESAQQYHLTAQTTTKVSPSSKEIDPLVMNAAFSVNYNPLNTRENGKLLLLNDGSSVIVVVNRVELGSQSQPAGSGKLANFFGQIEYALYVTALINVAKVEYIQQ